MNSSKLIEQMLQRLGQELKGLLAQAGQERLSAGAVEQVVRQRLWHFGGQLTAGLLEAMDPRLVAGRPEVLTGVGASAVKTESWTM